MVERILDTCARLLIEAGYDGVSTHRIVAEAGISPGSLYQYFPNKDAIVAMTVERMIGQVADRVLTVLAAEGSESDQRIRTAVVAGLEAAEQNRELVRVLVEQMPRLGGSGELKAVEQRAAELAARYLAVVTDRIGAGSPPARVWMAFQAFQQIIIHYVLDRPGIPRDEFIDELTRLLTVYTHAPGGPH